MNETVTRFLVSIAAQIVGMIFLGCFFGCMWVAVLRFMDRRNGVWLGVTEMWLPRESSLTRRGHDRNARPFFRERFLHPCVWSLHPWKCVYNAKRKEEWFSPLSCLAFILIIYNGELWYVPLRVHLFRAASPQGWLPAAHDRSWEQKRKDHLAWNAVLEGESSGLTSYHLWQDLRLRTK